MIDRFTDGKPWFAAKRFGYGSGLPIAIDGWIMTVVHVALITGVALLLVHRPRAMAAMMVVLVILPLPLYACKTAGGWRWRWGGRD